MAKKLIAKNLFPDKCQDNEPTAIPGTTTPTVNKKDGKYILTEQEKAFVELLSQITINKIFKTQN